MVNGIYWIYLVFCIVLLFALPITFITDSFPVVKLPEIIFGKYTDEQKAIIVTIVFVLVYALSLVNLYLLHRLRKILFRMKNDTIFTTENAKDIRVLFTIFATIFIITGIIVSGGIMVITAGIFLWVSYEIFFLAFDYKVENDALKEENTLTI